MKFLSVLSPLIILIKLQEAYKQKLAEFDSKIVEMEVRLRKKDESCMLMENEMRQRVQGLYLNVDQIFVRRQVFK